MPSLWLIPLKSVFPLIWFFYFPPLFSWKTIQESIFYGSPSPSSFFFLGISDLDHISNWCSISSPHTWNIASVDLLCLMFKPDPVGLIYSHPRLTRVLPVTQQRSSFKQFFTNVIVCVGLKPIFFYCFSLRKLPPFKPLPRSLSPYVDDSYSAVC